jgi:hypothetical protein
MTEWRSVGSPVLYWSLMLCQFLRFGRVTFSIWTGLEKLDHFSLVKCYVMLCHKCGSYCLLFTRIVPNVWELTRVELTRVVD